MPNTYGCIGNDHLFKIAGRNWITVWNLNSTRLGRARPTLLYKSPGGKVPGDVLDLPPDGSKQSGAPTGKKTPYSVGRLRLFLRIRILGPDRQPVQGASFTMQVSPTPTRKKKGPKFTGYQGTTDANGHIVIPGPKNSGDPDLPLNITSATLTVRLPPAAFGPPAPAPPLRTTPLQSPVTVSWNLRVGGLNPVETSTEDEGVSGAQQRLNNLGFPCGPVTGLLNPATEAALQDFLSVYDPSITNPRGRIGPAALSLLSDIHDSETPTKKIRPLPASWKPSAPPPDLEAGDLGCVAPDFTDPTPGAPTFPRQFNTLHVSPGVFPKYRLSLSLGEIDDLFPDPITTPRGRIARLQVLGLFYTPLKHRFALPSSNAPGVAGRGPARPDRTPASAYQDAWAWFKQKILRLDPTDPAGETKAEQALLAGLRSRIVSGAAPPAWDNLTPSALPPPAPDGTNAALNPLYYAKIRIPGGYTFASNSTRASVAPTVDPNYGTTFDFGADMSAAEDVIYGENPVLGKIPLVAFVEALRAQDGQWVPAPGVQVYFQLLRPYALPQAVAPFAQQFGAPTPRDTSVSNAAAGPTVGPKKVVVKEEAPNFAGDPDPQAGNCPKRWGGKYGVGFGMDGSAVANVIFACSAPQGIKFAYPPASPVTPTGTQHRHAVRTTTDASGKAGVLFTPSRMGGDRYRLRAYVGPGSLASDGTGAGAVAVDTGTFVVWRNVRISRFLQQPASAVHPVLIGDLADPPYSIGFAPGGGPRTPQVLRACTTATGMGGGFAALSASQMEQQLATAFCELEFDSGNPAPEPIPASEWREALDQAIADAEIAFQRGWKRRDMRTLLCRNVPGIDAANSFCNLPVRTPHAYNQAMSSGKPFRGIGVAVVRSPGQIIHPEDSKETSELLFYVCLSGFLRSLSKNGHLPGLTIVTGAFGFTWQVIVSGPTPGDYWSLDSKGIPLVRTASGVALQHRGAYVWNGAETYRPANFPYSFTSNVMHEIGHCLYRRHAPFGGAGGDDPAAHQVKADFLCLMGYQKCEGEFCGKCLLAFRGWRIKGMGG